MSILDKLFGHEDQPKNAPPQRQQASYQGSQYQSQPPQQPQYTPTNQPMSDDQAVARYQYMLRTAPPETIEQAHEEAFAQLTPEQRRMVLQQLSSTVPPAERPPQTADDPQTLARMATRAEVRQPGTMERLFGSGGPGGGSGLGMGSVIGGSLLTSLAGGFIGSAIADHFFRGPMGSGFFGGGGFGGGYGGAPVINETNIYNEGPSDARAKSDDSSVDSTSDDSATDDDTTDNLTDDSGSDDSTDYTGDDSGGGDYDSGDSGGDDF